MICFPNAKINLGLHILKKRQDGFHELETIFYPVQIQDALEFNKASDTKITQHGLVLDNKAEDNIVLSAYNLLKSKYKLPSLDIHLLKNIPFGAGLGGGSADAAFMLQALNDYFELNITNHQLKEYAAAIGSDCAFFIDNKAALAQGRGEILTPCSIDLKEYCIQIICPKIHVSTKVAYAGVKPMNERKDLSEIIKQDIYSWKDSLVNDFEQSVFEQFPALADIKTQLYEQGAIYAAMSGSGSSLFGIFPKNKKANIRMDIGFREFIS